ncbi:MAG: bifunctional phosphopantothenoylcysteine decarboxylase/phosphopantothenate--cysteine ligase CoaBC [Thermoplasmata archaeon]|nr:MAG: bifunctional phosphopantothenoylcysteine decarboxylase/phosphopantothenate--cysteine ligase CoaBC [Thermoplasmata archaeon]
MHPVDDIRGTRSNRLGGRTVVLGITGSIAAVECVHLARELARHGARVIATMTDAATRIVHPDALWFATGEPPILTLTGDVEHVRWMGDREDRADLLLVAPATANTIGKMALAIDDTPVTTFATTALGTGVPVVVAPAMHGTMWRHEGVLRNIESLRGKGVDIVHPKEEEKKAKLADVPTIVAHCIRAITGDGPLRGRRVLVVAGSTEEPIDRVRLISNRSSGGLGVALAEEAFARGAEVTMLMGRHTVDPPPYLDVVPFTTVESLMEAMDDVADDTAVVLAVAAISDYRQGTAVRGKIASGKPSLDLSLEPTPKVLPALRSAAPDAFLVSFKLEVGPSDEQLESIARQRLVAGPMDMVVANDLERVSADHHPAVIVPMDGNVRFFDGAKSELAAAILDTVEASM